MHHIELRIEKEVQLWFTNKETHGLICITLSQHDSLTFSQFQNLYKNDIKRKLMRIPHGVRIGPLRLQ